MGHSDTFEGQFTIDRPLDDLQILDILEDWHDGECKQYPELSIDGYCQWVIRKHNGKRTIIQYDGGEKFYDPDIWIKEVCKLLAKFGYTVNGEVIWTAEDDIEDIQKIKVWNNNVEIIKVVDMSIVKCPDCGHKFRVKERK